MSVPVEVNHDVTNRPDRDIILTYMLCLNLKDVHHVPTGYD